MHPLAKILRAHILAITRDNDPEPLRQIVRLGCWSILLREQRTALPRGIDYTLDLVHGH